MNRVPDDKTLPRETVKERNRRAIISAAGELASTRGMGSFTVAELAERAGTSRRSIFNHFPTVDDAVYAYLTSCIDPLIATLGALPHSFTSLDELIIRFEEMARSEEAYTILHHVGDVLSRDSRCTDTVLWASQIVDQTAGLLSDVVGNQLPSIDRRDVELISHALISAVQTSQTLWFRDYPNERTREEWSALLIRALELVRVGHRALS